VRLHTLLTAHWVAWVNVSAGLVGDRPPAGRRYRLEECQSLHQARSHVQVPWPVSQLAFAPQNPDLNMLSQSRSPEHQH
jgi:hypothetical protein